MTVTDYNGFVLSVKGEKVVTDVTANDGKWHFIALTWDSYTGSIILHCLIVFILISVKMLQLKNFCHKSLWSLEEASEEKKISILSNILTLKDIFQFVLFRLLGCIQGWKSPR